MYFWFENGSCPDLVQHEEYELTLKLPNHQSLRILLGLFSNPLPQEKLTTELPLNSEHNWFIFVVFIITCHTILG